MNRILNFSLFEREIEKSSDWDSDYDSLESNPLWIELKNRGFVNEPTPIMAKNKTPLIKNPKSPWFYPAGVVFQRSGYIRDKGASSGFVRNDLTELNDMLSYLIERYDKDLKKMGDSLSSIEGSDLGLDHIKLISSGTKAKWYYDKSTGRINVDGRFDLYIKNKDDKEKLYQIKFGKIKTDFSVIFEDAAFEAGETGSFSYAPQYVGLDFRLYGARLQNLEGLGKVERTISLRGENEYDGLSLEAISDCKELIIGDFFTIPYDIEHCLLVLENGCVEKSYTPNGHRYAKSNYSEPEEDNIARSIILTVPIMKN